MNVFTRNYKLSISYNLKTIMKEVDKSNAIRAEFLKEFYPPNYETRFGTITDLLWQILVNEIYKNDNVCFHVDVLSENYELIVAFEIGGFKRTNIFFKSEDYNECCEICARLSEKVFNLTKEQSEKLLSTTNGRNLNNNLKIELWKVISTY